MPYSSASAIEIDKKLRDDFRRRLRDYGIAAETTDPILAVLFRTLAQQLESLYSETGRIRLALLDELIAGLGIEQRMARPAQTVVRFLVPAGSQVVEAGTEMIGEAQSGERLTFTSDATIAVSQAAIAMAFTYQEGALQLMPGMELPEKIQNARPSLDAVKVNLGPHPAVFLAIEKLPATHLSRHSFFFELGPDAARIQEALKTETWCLFGAGGELHSRGILRPRALNAGVGGLQWLARSETAERAEGDDRAAAADVPALPAGFYGPRVFVMPGVPAERRTTCVAPRGMEPALGRVFGREYAGLAGEQRAWLRISFPREVPSLHTGIGSITMHAITASNVECQNQTAYFDEKGTSIPISVEAGTERYLVAPLSVLGEAGSTYVPGMQASSEPGAGRYTIRSGRIELQPARRVDATREDYANVRVWTTAGALGNNVGPGRVETFLKKGMLPGIRLTNPTSAAGGTNGEEFEQAQARFAAALLSRDRIITQEDLTAITRAFDKRIVGAYARTSVERTGSGMRRLLRVTVQLMQDSLADPEAEAPILKSDLTRHLKDRMMMDTELAVNLEWK
jgi:hypothetical protein